MINQLIDEVIEKRAGRLAEFLREFEPEFFEGLAARNECVSDEAIEEEVWRTIDCAPADVQPVMIDWLEDSIIGE